MGELGRTFVPYSSLHNLSNVYLSALSLSQACVSCAHTDK